MRKALYVVIFGLAAVAQSAFWMWADDNDQVQPQATIIWLALVSAMIVVWIVRSRSGSRR